MPLSEHEQRLLEEMERNLYQNDADFVATVGSHRGKPNYTLIVVGILVAILGIGIIVTGVVVNLALVGVGGFVVMFVGALLAISPPRRSGAPEEPSAAERAKASPRRTSASGPARGGFMDRLNERWDKRQDGRDDRE
ncbi:MAG: uncharacterized protein JWL94_1729 [Microbacteriaceae bacterium]|jgi:hypothetical protein|nr:uncharacterized protein [Microbacteriaceae bacterium]HEV7957051.1 DUF3040 domain-containing protein [Marisediminicola sp.]